MKYNIHIIFMLTIFSCGNPQATAPIWLNKKMAIDINTDTLYFQSSLKNIKALLISPIQPIPLQVYYTHDTLVIPFNGLKYTTTGHADICIEYNNECFYYPIYLNYLPSNTKYKDYLSPKTVNPDSSLQQQKIYYTLDENRMIIPTNGQYFNEYNIEQLPKMGTYRSEKKEPLSAFYIQPGSCQSIHINCKETNDKNNITITTSLLYDKNNNLIANGTAITFLFNNPKITTTITTQTKDGKAEIKVKKEAYTNTTIQANIYNTFSNHITLF